MLTDQQVEQLREALLVEQSRLDDVKKAVRLSVV